MSRDLNDESWPHTQSEEGHARKRELCAKEGTTQVRRQQESPLRRVAGRFISTDN